MKKVLIMVSLMAGVAVQAATFNATIPDPSTPPNPLNVFNGGPYGAAFEDNEVDVGIASQSGDLEAFEWDSSTKKLWMVGGYDFKYEFGSAAPGDLFVRMGEPAPGYQPTVVTAGSVPASTISPPYTYVVRLNDLAALWGAANSGSVGVHKLAGSDLVDTVTHDDAFGNPWKLTSWVGNSDFTIQATYYPGANGLGLTPAEVASLTGDSTMNALKTDGSGFQHYVVELQFGGTALADASYVHYTMACGNDVILGHLPDSGMTLALLGMAFTGLGMFGRRFRK